ncbi:hypothetical protein GQ44DRAFT_827980 [Phaeosphaeriaceae sp. PMI808]|nr:hypothetical protein GQ44DRAFT_827980 [Phaeosphaeriaceae sp. PMI808]
MTSFANETPIYLNIEVKRRHVARDPTIRLAAWVAAEFTKRRYEGWGIDFPVFTIEIDGDTWFLRVAMARITPIESNHATRLDSAEAMPNNTEDEYELIFLGPLALRNAPTIENSEKLFVNLLDIAKWGQYDYPEWWVANVRKGLEERL